MPNPITFNELLNSYFDADKVEKNIAILQKLIARVYFIYVTSEHNDSFIHSDFPYGNTYDNKDNYTFLAISDLCLAAEDSDSKKLTRSKYYIMCFDKHGNSLVLDGVTLANAFTSDEDSIISNYKEILEKFIKVDMQITNNDYFDRLFSIFLSDLLILSEYIRCFNNLVTHSRVIGNNTLSIDEINTAFNKSIFDTYSYFDNSFQDRYKNMYKIVMCTAPTNEDITILSNQNLFTSPLTANISKLVKIQLLCGIDPNNRACSMDLKKLMKRDDNKHIKAIYCKYLTNSEYGFNKETLLIHTDPINGQAAVEAETAEPGAPSAAAPSTGGGRKPTIIKVIKKYYK